MSSSCQFVYALVVEDALGNKFLVISPCGSADQNDLVFLEGGSVCEVKECVYVNRLSEEFQLLEKMIEPREASAVYALIYEKQ